MRLVFPCLPYRLGEVEPMFEPQLRVAEELGLAWSLLSYEDFLQEGLVRLRPRPDPEDHLLLRGWMLRIEEYAALTDSGWSFVTSAQDYARCHHLSGWIAELRDLTPLTESPEPTQEAVEELLGRWGRAFVKDEVKSCSLAGLPIIHSWQEFQALRQRMQEYQSPQQGRLQFRQVEDFLPESERRLFVVEGQVYHPTLEGQGLELGQEVATRIPAPFFAVDVVQQRDGRWRVVEVGDGQVSDLKEWRAEELLSRLSAHPGLHRLRNPAEL